MRASRKRSQATVTLTEELSSHEHTEGLEADYPQVYLISENQPSNQCQSVVPYLLISVPTVVCCATI